MIKIKFRSPVTIRRYQGRFGWKRRMKKVAREGKPLQAIKEIKYGLDLSLREAKDLWNDKYKSKYYFKRLNYELQFTLRDISAFL